MGDAIVLLIILLLTSSFFIGIGIYAFKKQTPIHFWSGSTVKPEEISNIKEYNRANGIMWLTYGFFLIFSGIIILINSIVGVIIFFISCFGGLFALVITYNRIYKKYKS